MLNKPKKLRRRGLLVVISAPSGTGKSTVVKRLAKEIPDLTHSISCTTRVRRPLERAGREYHFLSRAEFEKKLSEGYFVEWAAVHNALYGTPRKPLEQALSAGKCVIMDIDTQGAMAIKKAFPDAVTIFLLPPSQAVLKERLARRGTDTDDDVELRLTNAAQELALQDRYDHRVINDELEEAVRALVDLIEGYRR